MDRSILASRAVKRSRRVELAVAKYLSNLFPLSRRIDRIPAPGREGPDLTQNDLGLVVDVKSRLEVPKSVFHHEALQINEIFYAVPLCMLVDMPAPQQSITARIKTVTDWYEHMDVWRILHDPDATTALILHVPGMPVGRAMLFIRMEHLEKIQQKSRRMDD